MKYVAIIIAFAFVVTAGLGCRRDDQPSQADKNTSSYDKKLDGTPAAQEYVTNQDVIADQKKLSDQMNKVLVPSGADGSPKSTESTTAPASGPASAPASSPAPKK
jgi:hypothetical protein